MALGVVVASSLPQPQAASTFGVRLKVKGIPVGCLTALCIRMALFFFPLYLQLGGSVPSHPPFTPSTVIFQEPRPLNPRSAVILL